jgi:KDO2-lipid IV(A) lauroyltransferase
MSDERKPLHHYWGPRYWLTWLGMGILRVLCLLPHTMALALGRLFGRIVHSVAGGRRAIVRRNIELCFPDLSNAERDVLAKRHFEALGMSLMEMGIGRWASDKTHLKLARLDGLEFLQAALDEGKGVILLSAHFTTLEISGRVLAMNCPPFDAVYRRNRSEFITEIQRTGRERSADDTIEKRDIKKMVRNLRKGRPVWYAPDQSYDRKGSEVIPFFGVPSMHTPATSTLARLGGAVTLPFFPRRLEDGSYVHQICPPLENFPSEDPVADTKQYVRVLEEHIRSCPEQYLWIHRKFKNLPDDYEDCYSDLDALK